MTNYLDRLTTAFGLLSKSGLASFKTYSNF